MFSPLRHVPFRRLAVGRTITMFGNAMAPIALAFAVLDLTGSVTDVGLVVAARSMTNVLFVLFGGVMSDRLPRQFVMVASSALSFLTQGVIAVSVLTGHTSIAFLAGVGAINGITAAFAFPASSALLPQTVPATLLKEANALNRLGINSSMIAGASLGGLLVAGLGPGWGLAVDAFTFGIAAILFGLVKTAPLVRDAAAARPSTLHELREGWTEFRSRTWVWVIVLGFCFFNMANSSAVGVLGPALADETIGRTGWGLVMAASTAGMVAGAFVAMRVKARRLLLVGTVACLGEVVLLVGLGGWPHLALLIPLSFLSGIGIEQFGIAWEVSVQEHVPASKLARVYSYDALGSFLAIPLGQVVAGPLGLALGLQPALLAAAGIALLSVLGMLASRSVRTLAHEPGAAPVASEPAAVPA